MRNLFIGAAVFLVVSLAGGTEPRLYASAAPEFRAFWVDAYHTGIQTPADIDQLMATARATNCNAAVVQVRRRGDAYYISSYEPQATPGFDALAYLIQKAHDESPRIEVHAWLCTLPVSTSATPSDPAHPYNKYPEYLTTSNTGATFDGSNYSFDPGNPGALDYTARVYQDVVNRYDVDGIHFDYARFANANWGYNVVSVARFNAAKGHTGQPNPSNEEWKQWRRDQITALVRKIYAGTIAIKPWVKVSGSTITWGDGPADDDAWLTSSAYSSVLQDWRAWMEEGIFDINMPMCYDREHNPDQAAWYENWIAFCKDHKYNRQLAIGPAIYLNSIANSFIQIRKTRDVTPAGKAADGVVMYSYASTNDNNMDGTTMGPGDAPNSDFYDALVNVSSYDSDPPFAVPADVPDMPWKSIPTIGHLKGNVTTAGGVWADGAEISISGPEGRSTITDGTGFYAFIDLAPGAYDVSAQFGGVLKVSHGVPVEAGEVANVDFEFAGQLPVISNVAVTNVTGTSFTVTWTTDIQTTSKVEFGTAPSLASSTAEDAARVNNHSVVVSGLANLTPYYFRVVSNASLAPVYSEVYCAVTGVDPPSVIVDDDQGTPLPSSGDWTWSKYSAGYYGTGYRFCSASPNGDRSYEFRPNLPMAGRYAVYVWYVSGGNRCAAAPFTVYHHGGSTSDTVNQKNYAGGGFETNANVENVRITPPEGVPFAAGTDGYVVLSNQSSSTGNVMADAVKFAFVLEQNAPTTPTGLHASGVQTDSVTLEWDPSTDDSGISLYTVYRNGLLVGASKTTSFVDEGLSANRSYSYTVAAYDACANTSSQSDPAVVCTRPEPPIVLDYETYTASRTQFSASWSAADGGCGISGYSYAVGTSPGGTDLVDWTETAQHGAMVTVPEQPFGGKVYFSVKARNGAGEWSDEGYSDGIAVAHAVSSIGEAKALARGEAVVITTMVPVTAAFDGFLYVQDGYRCAGIRVEGSGVPPGYWVLLGGILGEVNGEESLTEPEIRIPIRAQMIEPSVAPLMVTGRTLGGCDFPIGRAPDCGQKTTTAWHWVKIKDQPAFRRFDPVAGLNNIGLLVRLTGLVSWVGSGSFYLDDGSAYDDTEQPVIPGVKVAMPSGVSAPLIGSCVSVVGVSSCYESGGDLYRLIRVRDGQDIISFE